MITDLAVEGLVEFGNFRKHANKFKKSGYVKVANFFSYFRALWRYFIIVYIKFIIKTGTYYLILTFFGKENNPNAHFTKRPIIAELSLNILLDSMIVSDLLIIY